jgi:hypothetical protein
VTPPFDRRELYRFLAKKVDAETHARIAAEIADPTSEYGRAYKQLRAKLLRPFQVNWPLVLTDVSDASDPGPTRQETEGDDAPPEDDFGAFFDLDLPDLLAEFELAEPAGAFRGPADHPLTPYLPVLKEFVRRTWNWPDRRLRPEYQDDRRTARDLAQALAEAQLGIPFPVTLVAVTLVKTGLDRLCAE